MNEKMRTSLLQSGLIPEVVAEAAERLKSQYVSARQVSTPGYSPRDANDQFFEKAAAQAMTLGASVDDWVSAQFSVEYIPNPAQMQGRAAEDTYARYVNQAKAREDEVGTAVATYARLLDRLSHKQGRLEDHVRVSVDSFGAVFLWCIATSLGIKDLVVASRANAVKLLRREPYLRVYQEAFPYLAKQLEELL